MSGPPPAAPDEALLVVLDIGKSNAKLLLVDPLSGREIASAIHANKSVPGAPRQLDVVGLTDWLIDSLAALPQRHRIGAIVPVAHGAACVMLDADGRPLLAPDYEDELLHQESALYSTVRDPFPATFSPDLPAGLNLGRQIHFVQSRMPALFKRVRAILLYPQYWAYVLSGVMASEVTSLGCHTDLWRPGERRYADLVERQGWTSRFPGLRAAEECLGPLRAEIASACGLPPGCVVLCGIHDSNASYLRHRVQRGGGDPFSVISSGTWTVVLASQTPLDALRAERDMLANVDASGAIVGTARFMGGREFGVVAGAEPPLPSQDGLLAALDAGAMVLPGFAPGGPFIGSNGRVIGADGLDRVARSSLASLYVALLTDYVLDLLQARGDVIVDGPLARNPIYCSLLAALRPRAVIRSGGDGAGSVGGARYLWLGRDPDPTALPAAVPSALGPALRKHRDAWRSAV